MLFKLNVHNWQRFLWPAALTSTSKLSSLKILVGGSSSAMNRKISKLPRYHLTAHTCQWKLTNLESASTWSPWSGQRSPSPCRSSLSQLCHLINWFHIPGAVEWCGLSAKHDARNRHPQVAQALRTYAMFNVNVNINVNININININFKIYINTINILYGNK